MKALLKTDIGRGITGVGLSIGIILAVMFPVFLMDMVYKFINLG